MCAMKLLADTGPAEDDGGGCRGSRQVEETSRVRKVRRHQWQGVKSP